MHLVPLRQGASFGQMSTIIPEKRNSMMPHKGPKKGRIDRGDYLLQRRIIGLFFFAVVIPGLILCIMVIRATNREQAFLEKQFQTAFEAETSPVVSNIKKLLADIQTQLDSTAPAAVSDIRNDLSRWKRGSTAVSIPFLFLRAGAFQWPVDSPTIASVEELDFLKFNIDFFLDRKTIEIYTPIPATPIQNGKSASPVEKLGIQDFGRHPPVMKAGIDPLFFLGYLLTAGTGGGELSLRERMAIYEKIKAGSKGASSAAKKARPVFKESLPYIKESVKFSQIIAGKSSGILSRIVDERIMLIYWKKIDGNRIVGCALREDWLRMRIAEFMPPTVSATRVLTILDQNEKPIRYSEIVARYVTEGEQFYSQEITSMLPKWRVAVYLADPSIIASKASARTVGIGVLVAILFLTLVVGGTVVIRALQSELTMARQRTTFVANVSHELKTPLTSIRLFAELLREKRQPDPEKQRQYFDIMVSETERLTRLINNVLDFSRTQRGGRRYSMRPLDLVGLCRETVENQRLRLEHSGFTVAFEHPAAEAVYTIDAEAIKQVLLNLLSNAEKYSPKEKWVKVSVAATSSAITIHVLDHGIGVPEKDEENIFKPFFRVDDSLTAAVRGTGLGLTISRQIIQDHGGDILYKSNKPLGSDFTIMLPLEKE
jgi:signal transduction histidine kinase